MRICRFGIVDITDSVLFQEEFNSVRIGLETCERLPDSGPMQHFLPEKSIQQCKRGHDVFQIVLSAQLERSGFHQRSSPEENLF